MKYINYMLFSLLVLVFVSCFNSKSTNESKSLNIEETTSIVESKSNIDIEKIKARLCNNFPEEQILKYNPDATHIEIEAIDNGSGGILHCKIKLFYGKKEYEYWEGQVSANINQMKDPFWQYNTERNATLYQKIDLGDKAVFISNMFQLQVLKDGVLYTITPPNRGNRTSSGKDTKEIAIEIAKHYNL